MPDHNPVIDKALADAKSTLNNLKVIPKTSAATPATAPAKKPDYSVARDARDTGKSINYNLKQKQAANTALSDVGE